MKMDVPDSVRWIGLAVAVGAAGRLGAPAVRRLCRAGSERAADLVEDALDEFFDLAPGRLVHGQGDPGGSS